MENLSFTQKIFLWERAEILGILQDEREVVEYISASVCHSNQAGGLFGTFVLTRPYLLRLALKNNLKREHCIAEGSKASPERASHRRLDHNLLH